MQRVTGIGGIFFKAKDPKALAAWYQRHLGLDIQDWGGALFQLHEAPGTPGYTVWCPFPEDTPYFQPSMGDWMLNLRVADLDGLLEVLKTEGVHVVNRYEKTEQGKFGYVQDPEGTLVELWEPAHPDL